MSEHGPTDPTSLPLFAGGDLDEPAPQDADVSARLAAGAGTSSPYARHTATPRPAVPSVPGDAGSAPLPEVGPPPSGTFAPDAAPLAPSSPALPSVSRVQGGSLPAEAVHGSDIDWTQVADLRTQASEMLTGALHDRSNLTTAQQRELGRAIIMELLQTTAAEHLATGRRAWSLDEQERVAEAVFNALFGLGRLQPLVDDERVENIEITGCDQVMLEYTDGTLRPGPPVAETDQELIDFLVFLASRSEVNARPFSEAQPRLHMRLDGGARLAATAWVTPRPSLVIRRHRLREITLEELAQRGMLDMTAVSFLRAAVRAKKSIVVAGPQGAGKTTMVRALCA